MAVPSVSVLMPFYDDGSKRTHGLFSDALSSVLSQDFSDFEVIIAASGQRGFVQKQEQRSRKIRVVFFEQKAVEPSKQRLSERLEGIVKARNLCLNSARGKYVAYADYDDISLPNRLSVQFRYLEGHRETGAVGSTMILIDGNGREVGKRGAFEDDGQIRRHLLQFNSMPQPTVMARLPLLKKAGGYLTGEFAEDYDLWVRMAKVTKFHNLQFPLVKYRVHSGGGATRFKFDLYFSSLRVKMRASRLLGIRPGAKDVIVNILQFISLFFPESLRRTVLERMRGKLVIGKR